ncbi:hypothetical protein EV127DRAFT_467154 [Xylaria flabelliformis]|nr:hypothetical protein EV127DRAFT_467154 [Xylaria flabelliformis]
MTGSRSILLRKPLNLPSVIGVLGKSKPKLPVFGHSRSRKESASPFSTRGAAKLTREPFGPLQPTERRRNGGVLARGNDAEEEVGKVRPTDVQPQWEVAYLCGQILLEPTHVLPQGKSDVVDLPVCQDHRFERVYIVVPKLEALSSWRWRVLNCPDPPVMNAPARLHPTAKAQFVPSTTRIPNLKPLGVRAVDVSEVIGHEVEVVVPLELRSSRPYQGRHLILRPEPWAEEPAKEPRPPIPERVFTAGPRKLEVFVLVPPENGLAYVRRSSPGTACRALGNIVSVSFQERDRGSCNLNQYGVNPETVQDPSEGTRSKSIRLRERKLTSATTTAADGLQDSKCTDSASCHKILERLLHKFDARSAPLDMPPLAQNTTSYLPFGTHFYLLKVIPVISSNLLTVYNHEGVPRCCKCLCLQLRPHSHQRDCPGPGSRKPSGFACLAGCGRIFTTSAYAGSHSTKCDGAEILRDRYGTCICPKCEMAGFAEKAIQKHIGKCKGKRDDTMRAYGGARTVHYCEGCGGCFFGVGLRNHACHIVGDPVWLGLQDAPPDLSISYVRWCRRNCLTLGGVPGQMPECIPDETVSEPLTESSPTETSWNAAMNGQSSSWEYNIDWDVVSDLDSVDDGGSEPDCESIFASKSLHGEDEPEAEDQGGAASEGARGQDQDVSPESTSNNGSLDRRDQKNAGDAAGFEIGVNRSQHLQAQSSLAAHRERMANKLRWAGITFENFEETPCEGLAWRHGLFPCPFQHIITAETAYFRNSRRSSGQKRLRLLPHCYKCAYLQRAIQLWTQESKFTVDGVHLCRRGGCRQPIAALWHCRFHADQVASWNVRSQLRLGSARVSSAEAIALLIEDQPRRTLVCPLWTLVKRSLHKTDASKARQAVFFVDTESLYDTRRKCFLVCEIAVRSASNEVLLDTLVDHGLTYRDLRQRVRPEMFGKLVRMYGFQEGSSRTHGMTPSQVSAALVEVGMGPSAAVVEWSLQGFDLYAMRQTFGDTIFPPRPLLGHRLWRDVGLGGSVALLPLFASMFPNSNLQRVHHRASIDCEKLFLVVEKAMQCFV